MNNTNVKLAKSSGFCSGVKNAVEQVFEISNTLKAQGIHQTAVLGNLIHNKLVLSRLDQQNIKTINCANEIIESGIKNVFIRTHGESAATLKKLQEAGLTIYDLTCPYVKKIHEMVRAASQANKIVIVIGDKQHPETIGIIGQIEKTPSFVATTLADLPDIEKQINNLHRKTGQEAQIFVVSQTTFSKADFKKISANLKKVAKTVEIFNTICYTTSVRQNEALEISKNSDVIFVLGDTLSSNTIKLYEICKAHCKNTYLIENTKHLADVLENFKLDGTNLNGVHSTTNRKNTSAKLKIGVVASASTPQSLIDSVLKHLQGKTV
ncbi:MAG: 4-hydroxy-3-methylbut-2-enyl diphosphate reductase [Firmicutes bacterium]|nr:4-hydroxy-3-methylbut-2-enyl diphosphate reductase [Bacillota bacterium]